MLIENIRKLAIQSNTTIAEIERQAGITRGTVGRWDKNIPSADKLYKIANLLSVSMEYLLTGENKSAFNSLSDTEKELLIEYKKLNDINKIRILERISAFLEIQNDTKNSIYIREKPSNRYITNSIYEELDDYKFWTYLLGKVSAGKGIDAIENKEKIKAPVQCDFALQVDGNSMEPKYHDKQILYFKKVDTVENGQIVAVQIEGEFIPTAFLKKVYIDELTAKLISLNSDYKEMTCPTSSLQVLGRVIDY